MATPTRSLMSPPIKSPDHKKIKVDSEELAPRKLFEEKGGNLADKSRMSPSI